MLSDLSRSKHQYLELLAINLSDNYYISYREAEKAITLSMFKIMIERLDDDGMKHLWNSDMNTIVNEVWNEYYSQGYAA